MKDEAITATGCMLTTIFITVVTGAAIGIVVSIAAFVIRILTGLI